MFNSDDTNTCTKPTRLHAWAFFEWVEEEIESENV